MIGSQQTDASAAINGLANRLIRIQQIFNRLKDRERKRADVLWMVEFFVLYWELIDLYQEKTKNFEKCKIFNYNTIKYRGINYKNIITINYLENGR